MTKRTEAEARSSGSSDAYRQAMNLKVVFRVLRRISLWSLDYYSDVYVAGHTHIPKTGPLVVTPCHHNEIIDIATISVTMPHRRPVCFWAKSSMFKNPIMGWVMSSSGAIPVRRNPNSVASETGNSGQTDDKANETRMMLFRETFQAMEIGEVIGLFPEGTSYTEPQIPHIKDGASWAALEYARWQKGKSLKAEDMNLTIVPVGIVYTDKARYQSRVSVTFGEPIDISFYAQRYLSAPDNDSARAIIKDVTAELDKRLRKLTINAPDWDTWFAASIARDISWNGSDNVPISTWVDVSQTFIDLFSSPEMAQTTPDNIDHHKKALVNYYGLLHHSGITHGTLASIYPHSAMPNAFMAVFTFIRQLLVLVLHPRLWFFLPPFLLHIPAYITGTLAARYLVKPGEDETVAELTLVPGGLAFGLTTYIVSAKFANMLFDGRISTAWMPSVLTKAGEWFMESVPSMFGVRRVLSTFAIMYWTTWFMFRWHALLIKGNYTQFQRTVVSWKVLLGVFSHSVPEGKLDKYLYPNLPVVNPFVKRRSPENTPAVPPVETKRCRVRSPWSWTLIRPLFAARAAAEKSVGELCH
ncbi:hypothetical protein BDW22DRAFT_1361799 [Trametopsis cervina]|nr:hypothetical protein BDW22DRAFT_1361799 [Trametopsis cervina]